MIGFDFPNIDPVAFSLGPLDIRWYALAYIVGFILGWRYCLKLVEGKQKRPNAEDIDDFLSWAVVGVIIGGRLGYVLFYQPDLYAHDPLSALKLWQGGMSFHGGMAGVVAALFLFCWRRKIEVLRLADLLACVAPIGLFFGRIANFINGELYGRPAPDLPWGVRFPSGGDVLRHPSQLYEAVLEGAALFLLLFFLRRMAFIQARSGVLAGIFLIGYGAARSFVELFRQPDAQLGLLWMDMSMGQLLSLPMVALGMAIVAIALRRSHASK